MCVRVDKMAKIAKTHEGKRSLPAHARPRLASPSAPGTSGLSAASPWPLRSGPNPARRGRARLLGAGLCPRNGVLWLPGTGALFRPGSRPDPMASLEGSPWRTAGEAGGGRASLSPPRALSLAVGSWEAEIGGRCRVALNGAGSHAGLLVRSSAIRASPGAWVRLCGSCPKRFGRKTR